MRRLAIWLLLPVIHGAKERPPHDVDDDAYEPSVDVLDKPVRPIRVPFGHIFKEGIEDPFSDVKQPVDLLELDLRTAMTQEEKERFLKEVPPERIYKIDQRMFRMYNEEEDFAQTQPEQKKNNRPEWFDFEAIHNQRSLRPLRPIPSPKDHDFRRESPARTHNIPKEELELWEPKTKLNWTDCTEFSKSSDFHPKDIVDIDWTPFFIWSPRKFSAAVVHRFTYPTKRIVKEYKTLYAHLLNATLDWEQPKLILNESIQILLIADPKDRRGLFHGVPRRPVPSDPAVLKLVHFAVPKIRLKIVDPYLAMSYCDDYFATIMAAPGAEPYTDAERIEEAAILNFTGIGYPVERDFEAERMTARDLLQRQKEAEETKFIKALNVDSIKVDME